jgi:hypothetical protein
MWQLLTIDRPCLNGGDCVLDVDVIGDELILVTSFSKKGVRWISRSSFFMNVSRECIFDLTGIVRIHLPPNNTTYRHEVFDTPLQEREYPSFWKRIQRYKDYLEIFLPNENFKLILMFYFGCCCSPSSFLSFFFLNRLHSCLCPPGLQCAR